jgi:hypothetical protein
VDQFTLNLFVDRTTPQSRQAPPEQASPVCLGSASKGSDSGIVLAVPSR